jgi:hypothetical protein
MTYFLTVFIFVFALIVLSYTILGRNFFIGASDLHNFKVLCDENASLITINRLASKEWNNKLFRLFYFHVKILFFFKLMIILQLVSLSVSAIFLPSKLSQSAIRIADLFTTNPSSPAPPVFIIFYIMFVVIYILILIFSWVYIDFVESETKKIKNEIENYLSGNSENFYNRVKGSL